MAEKLKLILAAVIMGVWPVLEDAMLDAGDQVIYCYGQRSTVNQHGICSVCKKI